MDGWDGDACCLGEMKYLFFQYFLWKPPSWACQEFLLRSRQSQPDFYTRGKCPHSESSDHFIKREEKDWERGRGRSYLSHLLRHISFRYMWKLRSWKPRLLKLFRSNSVWAEGLWCYGFFLNFSSLMLLHRLKTENVQSHGENGRKFTMAVAEKSNS